MPATQASRAPQQLFMPAPIDAIPGAERQPQDQQTAKTWRTLAKGAAARGETALALRGWLHVREIEPDAGDAMFQIGCCYALLGDRRRACLIFDGLIDRPGVTPKMRRCAERLLIWLEPNPL